MTDINDHLARIEEALPGADLEAHRALARVKDEVVRLRDGLEIIANSTYPARYVGEAKDGTKMYGDSGDAPRFARALLDDNERDGREPDGYRIDGGRVIPTDR